MQVVRQYMNENKWLRLALASVIANAVAALFMCVFWWMQCSDWKSCHNLAVDAPAKFFAMSALAISTLAANGVLALGGGIFLIKGLKLIRRAE